MKRFLYSVGIGCYATGVRVAALTNDKARKMVEGWSRTFGRLSMAPVGKGKTAWFHASSLGEFEQTRPVLEEFRKRHPEYKICVTFFSPSGYEVRKDYAGADFVCYLPPDTRGNAARFLNLLHPTVAFFAKYDFWFNYLEQLSLRGVPTYIYSSIFRPDQYFFRWYGRWFLKHLRRCFTHIFVQNEESLELLKGHGVERCMLAGDTRFDRVAAIVAAAEVDPLVEGWLQRSGEGKVVVCGSTWEPDEDCLHRYLMHRGSNVRMIVAPHEVGEERVAHVLGLFGRERCTLYSELKSGVEGAGQVLVVDNVGLLSRLYRYAEVAYVGGGFGRGIHNTLEAVAWGTPVAFGPRYEKFQEAKDIIAVGGALGYERYEDLEKWMDRMLDDSEAHTRAAGALQNYMNRQTGTTEKVMQAVERDLKRVSP